MITKKSSTVSNFDIASGTIVAVFIHLKFQLQWPVSKKMEFGYYQNNKNKGNKRGIIKHI